MNFSSILDISSFFIGIIINLLFVALMCYYFKSKYDNLELAQTEQAKILYEILQKERRNCILGTCPVTPVKIEQKYESESESESETESETESESESESEQILPEELEDIKHLSIIEDNVPQEDISFTVTKVEDKQDEYGKMTMKQLKELLSNKGIKTKPNMRKDELIDLIQRKNDGLFISSSPPFGSFSSENVDIEGIDEIHA
jgi:hypothetical protein